jgi:hypothetical protein
MGRSARVVAAFAWWLACGAATAPVEPAHGSVRGGERVRIAGERLRDRGTVVVRFAGQPARGVVLESQRRLVVLTPPASAPGPVEVRLEFADGSVDVLPDAFTYEAGAGFVLHAPVNPDPAGTAAGR